jgi:SAM-dependent methyltransferase
VGVPQGEVVTDASARGAPDLVVCQPAEYWRRVDVARRYDSRRFENLKGRLYRWREERALERALYRMKPRSRILDAACGTGRITALLLRKGFRATGCDISLAMMAVAHQRLRALGYQAPLVEGNVERLPYPDNTFDGASCIGLLMHLDTQARVRALRELARVSRGPLVIQYGCVGAFGSLKTLVSGRPPGQVRFPVSVAEMRMDLERCGLTERARFWILRGLSSSVVVLVDKSGCV